MVVFDATTLLLLLSPTAAVPAPGGKTIPQARERIGVLVDTLDDASEKIAIPTPALAEALVTAADPEGLVAAIRKMAVFQIENFDDRAAIELALMTKKAVASPDKKSGVDRPWQLIKFDRQIVAIAKVVGARCIYSDDGGLTTFAEENGIPVTSIASLPLPPPDLLTLAAIERDE